MVINHINNMEFLYISSFPDKYFEMMQKISIKSISQPSQKFNYLLTRGIKLNDEKITVLNIIDYLAIENKNKYNNIKIIKERGIDYIFLPVFGYSLKYRFEIKTKIYDFLKDWDNNHKESIIIVDALKPYAHFVYDAAKKIGIPIISIITDLPEHLYFTNSIKNILRRTLKIFEFNHMMEYSNGYIFLTEKMNQRLNKKNKDFLIIEGVTDIEYDLTQDEDDETKCICLYSGALHARYGIKKMVDAFMAEEMENIELNLYGDGDCVEYIKECCMKYSNIKYFGVVDNKTILDKQKKASVLLNPRPIDEKFTEYSFPSKNMEYMSSGTPVLTTKLSGMPEEYLNYVYILDASNVNSIVFCIKSFFAIDYLTRKKKGKEAQKFILETKNNKVQAKKIIDLSYIVYEKG